MIVNKKTGAIAYHALLLKEGGGLNLVQYDFDGKPLERSLTENEEFVYPSLQDTIIKAKK